MFKAIEELNPKHTARPGRPTLRALGPWALAAIAISLASCGDDGCDGCSAGYLPSEVSYGLVAADFSGNGYTSIVQTSTFVTGDQPAPGNLKVDLSNGPGAFSAPTLLSAGHNPLYLATADFNGDHLADLVSASYDDGSLSVFFNGAQGPGTFGVPMVLPSPGASQVAIGDMNGDGLPDLISADFNVSLFLQTSPGKFASPVGLYSGGANWVAVGDLNADGVADVALSDNTGVKLLFHSGSASVTAYEAPVVVYTEAANAAWYGANLIAIADVNGDSLNDLVITDPGPVGGSAPTVAVMLQNSNMPGTFLAPVGYPTAVGSLAQSISVADVNGDGLLDVVIGGSNAVSVLLQASGSPGTFQAAANYAAVDANEIALADINGDGRSDIVVGTGPVQPAQDGMIANQAGVLLQNATVPGTFTALQTLP
ncbi:MAG TPA: VCBS repeat-containing protein [Steroidobacteraceae bacterium]